MQEKSKALKMHNDKNCIKAKRHLGFSGSLFRRARQYIANAGETE
jgi:hypothetical protein